LAAGCINTIFNDWPGLVGKWYKIRTETSR